jgi:DNA polymerase III subunit chi
LITLLFKMTQVDFYFNAPDLMRVAQKLIAKALLTQPTVVVAGEAHILADFDAYLWGFDAASFVPHAFATDPVAAQTPVLLVHGANDVPRSHYGLLINMGSQVPELAARFTRVLELVGATEASKIAGRERFTYYKQRGYPMKPVVDLAKK